MNLSIYRFAAVSCTTAALMLFTLGLGSTAPHERDFYAWGFLMALLAATAVVLLSIEVTVARVIVAEARRSRACLAEAVAKALADELEERERSPELRSVR